jgi:hypothetical protein
MTDISPPTVTLLIVRVSRLNVSTRVGSAAKAAVSSGSPGSGGSLNAMWPLIPIPPKHASTPPRRSISRPISSGRWG